MLATGGRLPLNAEGFLSDPALWTRDVAAAFAERERVGVLTEKHWRVIDYVREHYQAVGEAPRIRAMLHDCRLQARTLYRLFPTGPAAGACKLAGLPTPAGCH